MTTAVNWYWTPSLCSGKPIYSWRRFWTQLISSKNPAVRVLRGPFDIKIGKVAVVRDHWGNEYTLLDTSKGTFDTDSVGNVTGVS